MITSEQFAAEYEKHFTNTVLFFASKAYRNPEEVAQAGWVRAWEKRELYRGEAQIHTWVIRIARNLYLMSVRHKPFEQMPRKWDSPVRSHESWVNAAVDVERIFSRIRKRERDLLTDRYMDQKSTKEMSGGKCTLLAMRIRISRAKQKAAMAAGA